MPFLLHKKFCNKSCWPYILQYHYGSQWMQSLNIINEGFIECKICNYHPSNNNTRNNLTCQRCAWCKNLKCISILHEAPITRKLHFFLFFYVLKLMRHFYQVGWKTFAGMTGASVIKYAHPGPRPILRWGCLKNVELVFTFLPFFPELFQGSLMTYCTIRCIKILGFQFVCN